MSTNDTLTEIRDLLGEIRDLLLPVADAHQDEYERRQAERHEQRLARIRETLSTPKRQKAWKLADGSRTQRELAKESGMDEGGASRFFKTLRELGALTDAQNPTRAVEVSV